MTSLKQIEANRRNAQKSTGPATLEGKERSRRNALRHGLTAQTVIGMLENAEHYAVFEAAIAAEYDPQSVIERELVARLASLFWRLRRAAAIETGLFEMQADPLADFRNSLRPAEPPITAFDFRGGPEPLNLLGGSMGVRNETSSADHLDTGPNQFIRARSPTLAQCFLRLTNLPNFALDRLSRYEASLWRQADQIIVVLDDLQGSRKSLKRDLREDQTT